MGAVKRCTVLRAWCRLAILVACLANFAYHGSAAAEEHLYPHAERESGPWGYIDKTGRVVIPLQFEWAAPFSEGLAAVRLGKKFGFIDSTGRLAIQPRFDTVRPFQSGRVSVRVGSDWGFIDGSGAEMGPTNYTFTQSFNSDRAPVGIRGTKKAGAVDLSGRLVIGPEFDGIAQFSEGMAKATRSGKFGYIDTNGKVVAPFEFDRASEFRKGRALVRREATKEWGFIDKTGAFAVLPDFDLVFQPSEGLALVMDKQRRIGAIDTDGRIVIPPQFAHAGSASMESGRRAYGFQEGFLPVSEGRGFGYIDKQGSYVIQPQFISAGPFQDGIAVVFMAAKVALHRNAKGALAGLIDRSGKLVAPPVYDWAKRKPGGVVQVKFGDRLGYVGATGRPLTFSSKDIEEYVARKREELKPPAPGRAVVGKAGDTEYYLRLPEGLCALSSHSPEDRKLLEDFWAMDAAAAEEAARKLPHRLLPQISEETARELRKSSEALKSNFGLIASCDQLKSFRAGRDWAALKTYAIATGLQKDRYDFSGNAGIVYMAAFLCTIESTSLPALAREPLACYSASLSPLEGDASMPPGTPPKARVAFHTMVFLPDWLVQVFTKNAPVESPDALFRELQREKALVKALQDANFKKKPR